MSISKIVERASFEIIYSFREMDNLIPVSFLLAWFRSRSYRSLFWGVPAILWMVMLIVGVYVFVTKSEIRGLAEFLADTIQVKAVENTRAIDF